MPAFCCLAGGNYLKPTACSKGWLQLVGCVFTSHRQQGHSETAPPCEGRKSSVFTPFPQGIEPRAIAWQSITLPLHHASSIAQKEKPVKRPHLWNDSSMSGEMSTLTEPFRLMLAIVLETWSSYVNTVSSSDAG